MGGSDEITMTAAGLSPASSDGNALGTASLEWSDLFLADGAVINFGDDQDVSLTHVADTGLLLSSTDQLQFGDSGTYIHQSADGVLDLVSDTEIEINATTIDVNGNLDVSGTIVSGGTLTATTSIGIGSAVLTEAEMETLDGVTAGTAIASKVVTTDANIDTTGQRNLTITGELDAATGDFSGDVDIDGTANLDTVDIDGATQIDATVTVGVDDTGYDVKFFGATSGAYMLWDESVDDLILAGAARLVVPDGNLVLGSTAVTSTPAEINLIDGGATVGTTAVADGDGLLHNDNGTMKVTSAATFKTYFQAGLSSAADDISAGDSAVTITTSSGDITIDAAANDSDIIFKGTDGGSDTTFLTIDGSAAGAATFNDKIIATELDISGNVDIDGTTNLDAVDIDGAVQLDATLTIGANDQGYDVILYGDTASANLTWDTSVDDLILNGAARIVVPDGQLVLGSTAVSSTAAELNLLDGVSGLVQADLTKLAAVDSTAAELNIVDGGTSATSTTVADADRVVLNDNGTMVQVAVTDLSAYFDDEITAMPNLVTVGATQQLTTIAGIPLYSDSTSLYTHNVSGTDDSAEYNTAIGFTTLDAITTGDKNTAMGYGALGANTTGYNNTAIGHLAGLDITEGYQNTLVGDRAGTNITTGDNNTAIGQNAMTAVTTQNRNTAVGMDALKVGTNDDCVAIGAFALTANSTGADNTAVGSYALTANTTGGSNVAVGFDALKSNTTGNRNIVVGNEAYDGSDTESDNLAIGHAAMTTDTAGGIKNVAIGNYALDALTSGDSNVAIGMHAGSDIQDAIENVIIGEDTGKDITSGAYNVIVGRTSGSYNTNLTTGDKNTILGSYSYTTAADSDHAIVIGHGVAGAQDYTTLGYSTSDIRAAHGTASWATVSDERVKKDITDSTAGLSVINDLRPRTFKYKNKGDLPEEFDAYEEGSTEAYKENTYTNHGFIAQEVKEVIDNHPELKDGFRMWDIREHTGQQEVGETAIIPVLVKAVQELSAKNTALEAKVKALEDA